MNTHLNNYILNRLELKAIQNETIISSIKEYASLYWECKGEKDGKKFYNIDIFDFDADMLNENDAPTLTVTDFIEMFSSFGYKVSVERNNVWSIRISNIKGYTQHVADTAREAMFKAIKEYEDKIN